MHPGAGALADGIQTGDGGAPIEVGGDPAHHVVRGRRHRDGLSFGIDPRGAQRADDVREQRGIDVAHVELDPAGAGQGHLPLHGPRNLVARGELVDEPLAARVQQPRPLAADRLGDEEARRRRRAAADPTAVG